MVLAAHLPLRINSQDRCVPQCKEEKHGFSSPQPYERESVGELERASFLQSRSDLGAAGGCERLGSLPGVFGGCGYLCPWTPCAPGHPVPVDPVPGSLAPGSPWALLPNGENCWAPGVGPGAGWASGLPGGCGATARLCRVPSAPGRGHPLLCSCDGKRGSGACSLRRVLLSPERVPGGVELEVLSRLSSALLPAD